MEPRPDDDRRTTWLSLSDASRLLGVSTATVRRWADSGRLPVYTTPGGHRRFSRTALERMLPGTDRGRAHDLVETGLTPARLSRAYRRSASAPVGRETAWLATLDPEDRDAFRRLGRQLAWELVAHLDADEPEAREQHLAEATSIAVEYGRRGGELGLSMSDVVEGFLAFRRPFLAEVGAAAERRGLAAADVNDAHDAADQALDRLLVATMSGHRARASRRPSPSRPRSAP